MYDDTSIAALINVCSALVLRLFLKIKCHLRVCVSNVCVSNEISRVGSSRYITMTYSDYHIHFPLWSHLPQQTLWSYFYPPYVLLLLNLTFYNGFFYYSITLLLYWQRASKKW